MIAAAEEEKLAGGRPIIWRPMPKQEAFLECSAREACYGGALGGGKTDCLEACGVSQIENPKHRAIFFRKSFPQLRSAIERSHEIYRPLGGVYNVQTSTWTFQSGAKIEFAFLDSETDKWRYAGRAFNCILWDELCEWPNDSAYVYMLSRLRTTKGSGLRLEVRSSANPLGPGASWVRQRFNIPADGSASECIDPETRYRRVFFPAKVDDNVHLAGSEYVRQLQALPRPQRKALLDGRWDSVAGAVFEEFDHASHVVDPFPIPVSWEVWRGGDWGFRAPSAILWLAHDRHGTDTIYVINEIYAAQQTPEALARRIRYIDFSLPIDFGGGDVISNDCPIYGLIDSAAFSNSGTGSPAVEMNKLGARWKPAEKGWNSRLAGISAIHQRLATREDGTVGLKFFKNCVQTIRELPSLTYDPTNLEDIDQNCSSDHCFDALRYGLTKKHTWTRTARVKLIA